LRKFIYNERIYLILRTVFQKLQNRASKLRSRSFSFTGATWYCQERHSGRDQKKIEKVSERHELALT